MPDRLDQRSAAPTEDVDVAREGISPEAFLHLQCQAPHAAPHVGVTRGDPDPDTRSDRDHPRRAASTRRRAARFTSLPTRTCCPLPNSISISPGAAAARGGVAGLLGLAVDDDAASIMCTGMNTGTSRGGVSTPCCAWRRHVNRRLSQTLCRAATAR